MTVLETLLLAASLVALVLRMVIAKETLPISLIRTTGEFKCYVLA
jgi:hypothetical protein